jgi:ABC-2 type transport system permease protein
MNLRGCYTLYLKEVNRFLNVFNQTLVAPLINALLLLSVFKLSIGNRLAEVEGMDFVKFIIPGLIMMTVVQNAFANTSSTLTFGKVLGVIIDTLLPPLSPRDITIAMALGGVTRGICSGLVVGLAIYGIGLIWDETLLFEIHHLGIAIFYLFFSSLMLSLLGMITGIFSDSFDQMAAITSFIITPLSFLSGTFYSVKSLPETLYTISHFNPFFYMIDGFRYSLTGYSDFSIQTGMIALVAINIFLYAIVYYMLKTGYRIKS